MKLSSIPAPAWYALAALVAGYFVWRQAGAAAAKVGNAVNPLNRDNVFAASVNAAGAAVSGDDSFSLGAWLYDVTHKDEFKG